MKKFMKKRFLIFLFPVVAIFITVTTLVFSNKDDGLKQSFVVEIDKEQTYRKVYMLDKDNYLVPLTLSFDSKELMYMFIVSGLPLSIGDKVPSVTTSLLL